MTEPTMIPTPDSLAESSELSAGLDLQAESREALRRLLDRVAIVVLTLGTIGTAASVLRVLTAGWHVNVFLDVVFYSAFVGTILLRRLIPTQVVISVIIGLVLLSSLANFVTLGLVTISFTMLATCVVVTAVAFGVRSAAIVLGGATAAVLILVGVYQAGLLTRPELSRQYLHSPLTWISQITGFLAYTGAMLATIGSTRYRLERTLRQVSLQAQKLRASEELYRLLAEDMRDVLFRQDMDLNIVYVSPSVEHVFGYTPEEAQRLKMSDVLTPESLERARRSFSEHAAKAAAGELRIPPLELEYVRKDGSTCWGELRPSFVHDAEGKPVATQGLVIDLTERKDSEERRKELENRLRQSEKLEALGQLAGGVAHDFNNQLVGVTAYAQLLKEDRPDDPLVVEYADNILGPARRAAELTGKLLAFARKGTFRRTDVNLHDIIDEVVAILRRSIDKSIKLVRHYEAASAIIEGDASQLQNAILNVGLNARDAMPDGGEVIFSTRTVAMPLALQSPDAALQDQCLELTVEDTGTGMPPDVAERIFEPFFTTKEPGQGTGMGLAAVHGTVEAHGGRITVASAPGEGSVFTMQFPLVGERHEPLPRTAHDERLVRGRGRVLVVDDEDTVRAALSRMLKHLGYSVDACANGREALTFYEAHADSIDLVLLDLVLPEMRGSAVMQRLQRIRGDVKVVIVSGYTADQDVQALEESGAAGFLSKPFSTEELSKVIARALGRDSAA
ncbi:MAG: response regulator [Chitinivibrionales bacterium]|nr:response regulator [Chitinivibrionales bacterium]